VFLVVNFYFRRIEMVDIVDLSSDNEMRILASNIANCKKEELPKATGFCFECDDVVPKGRRFCEPDPKYGSCEDTFNKRRTNKIKPRSY
jgi:hypothetical protein